MIDVEIPPQDWLDTVAGYYEALYHDLKTPMALLFGHVQSMEKMEKLPPDAVKCVADIKRACFRMAKLVRDANDRSRLNQGLLRPKYVMTDAVGFFRNICESAQALMNSKDVKIIFNSPVPSFEMAMDRQLWERVVLNLLANSKDFSYHGGEIHVVLQIKGADFILSIRDFGSGVPDDITSHVFSRHFGDTERGLRSGLGLYIVKELAALMNGEVQLVRSNPGTEVMISVPVFYTEDEHEAMTVDDFFADNMVQMELSNI